MKLLNFSHYNIAVACVYSLLLINTSVLFRLTIAIIFIYFTIKPFNLSILLLLLLCIIHYADLSCVVNDYQSSILEPYLNRKINLNMIELFKYLY